MCLNFLKCNLLFAGWLCLPIHSFGNNHTIRRRHFIFTRVDESLNRVRVRELRELYQLHLHFIQRSMGLLSTYSATRQSGTVDGACENACGLSLSAYST